MRGAPVEIVGIVGHVRHRAWEPTISQVYAIKCINPFAQVPARLLHFFSSLMSISIREREARL
jgi:hypothetical protein